MLEKPTLYGLEVCVKTWGDPIALEDVTEVWGLTLDQIASSPHLKITKGFVEYIGE